MLGGDFKTNRFNFRVLSFGQFALIDGVTHDLFELRDPILLNRNCDGPIDSDQLFELTEIQFNEALAAGLRPALRAVFGIGDNRRPGLRFRGFLGNILVPNLRVLLINSIHCEIRMTDD